MSIHRRTLTSPKVAKELYQLVHADHREPRTPFGHALKRIESWINSALLCAWAIILVAMPLVLVLLVVGLGNYTVEWLKLAAGTLLVTFAPMAGISAVSSLDKLASGDHSAIKGVVGALIVLVSIALLGWVAGVPKSEPPSLNDTRIALFAGTWFAVLCVGLSLDNFVKNKEISLIARSVHLTAFIFYGTTSMLLACDFAFGWRDRPEMQHWTDIRSFTQMAGLTLFLLASSLSQSSTATDGSPEKRTARLWILMALIMIAFFMLTTLSH